MIGQSYCRLESHILDCCLFYYERIGFLDCGGRDYRSTEYTSQMKRLPSAPVTTHRKQDAISSPGLNQSQQRPNTKTHQPLAGHVISIRQEAADPPPRERERGRGREGERGGERVRGRERERGRERHTVRERGRGKEREREGE